MNETWKRALVLGGIGFVAGAVIGAAILLFSRAEVFSDPSSFVGVVLDLLFSGLNGAICMGSTVVYGFEHWSVARTTIVHFCITFSSLTFFYTIGVLCGWISVPSVGSVLILFGICLVVYFAIWFSQYLSYKKQVRRLNDDLEKIKEKEE